MGIRTRLACQWLHAMCQDGCVTPVLQLLKAVSQLYDVYSKSFKK